MGQPYFARDKGAVGALILSAFIWHLWAFPASEECSIMTSFR
jgi:hypothetical protein